MGWQRQTKMPARARCVRRSCLSCLGCDDLLPSNSRSSLGHAPSVIQRSPRRTHPSSEIHQLGSGCLGRSRHVLRDKRSHSKFDQTLEHAPKGSLRRMKLTTKLTVRGVELTIGEAQSAPLKPDPSANQESPRGNYVYAHLDDSGTIFYVGR